MTAEKDKAHRELADARMKSEDVLPVVDDSASERAAAAIAAAESKADAANARAAAAEKQRENAWARARGAEAAADVANAALAEANGARDATAAELLRSVERVQMLEVENGKLTAALGSKLSKFPIGHAWNP